MQKLTYLGTRISPNQIVTKQGYLLCTNVPICRTGTQSYLGSELEGHPGYDPAWGLLPHERYSVLRPLEEVTNAATLASFEGATVVDEHPDPKLYPGSLVTCENDSELNRGHGQNVRVGDPLPGSGDIPLLADLHIKDIDLIDKVDKQDIRDVSCGYTFLLVRRPDGQLVQTNIRGNHIAIVPTGRAGKEVAISDAEPPIPQKKEKKPVKSIKDRLIGLGLIAAATATDADPEEIARMAKEATKDEDDDEAEKKAEAKAAKDAEAAEEKEKKEARAAMDAEGDHPEGCRCMADDCVNARKSMKDKAAKDAKSGKDTDVEDLENPDDQAAIIDDGEKVDPEIDDLGESTLKGKGVLDSARNLVTVLKPLMGSGQMPKAAVDAYNTHVKALNAAKGTKASPYAAFVNVGRPPAAVDAAPELINPGQFFNGRTYAEGKRLLDEHLAKQKGAK